MNFKPSLLLTIFLTLVICSISVEQETKILEIATTTTVAPKKKVSIKTKDEDAEKEKEEYDDEDEQVDYMLSALSSNPHSRYTKVDPTEENYRMRSRWPSAAPSQSSSSLESLVNGNDWSRLGFGQFPTATFDRNPLLTTSQSCHSLVDPQYIIFSDTCAAVPQARYSLPNLLGHRERWQMAQVLTSLVGSTTDPVCTRSLRLLLCPVLFPPCPTRYEPPAVLPCQSYCRAIKSRCSIPALDILPCEILPHSSDLCPTNQLYSSLAHPGIFPTAPPTNSLTGGFPSANYQTSRSYPTLQSILSSQNIQSTSPTANSPKTNPFGLDSLPPVLVDFPLRSFPTENRQNSRYSSLSGSSNEARLPTSVKSSVTSSVVRA